LVAVFVLWWYNQSMVRYVDTFSGIGGFSLGIHSVLGDEAKCVLAIDYDKNVSETFFNNFGINSYGNIRELEVQNIPDHDIIFGGFPCQPFSRNGKWFNKNDKTIGEQEERDNLFLELVRILVAKKPKYFVFENVKGLLSMKNMDGSSCFDTIVQNLNEAGYDVHTKLLDAVDFGVPQQRERIFFVGIRSDLKQEFKFPTPSPIGPQSIEDILEKKVSDKYLISNLWKKRTILGGGPNSGPGKKNHDFPNGHSRYEVIKWLYEDNSKKPTQPTGKIESVAILYGDTPSGLPRQQDKIYSVNGISPTIATFSTPAVDSKQGLRQLTPRECARLQGFPETYIFPQKDAVAYKQIGNAVAVPVIAAIVKQLLGDKND